MLQSECKVLSRFKRHFSNCYKLAFPEIHGQQLKTVCTHIYEAQQQHSQTIKIYTVYTLKAKTAKTL